MERPTQRVQRETRVMTHTQSSSSSSDLTSKKTHVVGGVVVCAASEDDENQFRGDVVPCDSPNGEMSTRFCNVNRQANTDVSFTFWQTNMKERGCNVVDGNLSFVSTWLSCCQRNNSLINFKPGGPATVSLQAFHALYCPTSRVLTSTPIIVFDPS